jgi:hypothetical protein
VVGRGNVDKVVLDDEFADYQATHLCMPKGAIQIIDVARACVKLRPTSISSCWNRVILRDYA